MHEFELFDRVANAPRYRGASTLGAVAHLTVASAETDCLSHLIEEPLFLLLERPGAAGIVRPRRFGELGFDLAEPGTISAPGLIIEDLHAASGGRWPSAQRETVQLLAGSREKLCDVLEAAHLRRVGHFMLEADHP
jgi:hypothetical protein